MKETKQERGPKENRVTAVRSQVEMEDLAEALPRQSGVAGAHAAKDGEHLGGRADLRLRARVVEEVDVDAVGVVGRADRYDSLKRGRGLVPSMDPLSSVRKTVSKLRSAL